MRKLVTLALVAVATLALATSAVAQPDPYDIGMFFDTAGNVSEGVVPGFAAPTRLYLLMLNLGEQIVGYELSVAISGPASETWIVTRGSVVGLDVDASPDGYVVGIGVCAGTVGQPYQINTYDFAYFTSPQGPMDTLVCTNPPTVGNPSIPGFPSYQTCAGSLEAGGFAQASICTPEVPDGCAVINPSTPGCVVATEETSFGALKATY